MTMSGEELCAKLFEEHYAELVRYAARLVGDPHLAEDIVVEAILVALKRSEELLTYDSPKHWLMRVVKNKSKNEMRRKYHQVEVDITEAGAALFARTDETALFEMLPRELSETDKKILILRFEKQLEYDELAESLGITDFAARQRVSRAVRRMRKLMARDEEEEPEGAK